MNRTYKFLSVLLTCLLISSMSITAFAAGDQGGNSTVVANIPATVTFDANGGSGTMETDSVAVGGELTLPQCGFTAPGGKQFKCWEIGSDTYDPGDKITVDSHITVKAIWKDAPGGGTSDTPQTGDTSHLLLWTVLLLVSSFSIVLLLVSRKRRTN